MDGAGVIKLFIKQNNRKAAERRQDVFVPTLKKLLPGCLLRRHPPTPETAGAPWTVSQYRFGENGLKREAQCGRKGADQPPWGLRTVDIEQTPPQL